MRSEETSPVKYGKVSILSSAGCNLSRCGSAPAYGAKASEMMY